ncbi:hypothetical protein EDC01DRAFT_665433 [Geopyxis carbonaria]|nr:hypothetical protein EDC01DRAFT_665433 [Geopyxis carbonaria]
MNDLCTGCCRRALHSSATRLGCVAPQPHHGGHATVHPSLQQLPHSIPSCCWGCRSACLPACCKCPVLPENLPPIAARPPRNEELPGHRPYLHPSVCLTERRREWRTECVGRAHGQPAQPLSPKRRHKLWDLTSLRPSSSRALISFAHAQARRACLFLVVALISCESCPPCHPCVRPAQPARAASHSSSRSSDGRGRVGSPYPP